MNDTIPSYNIDKIKGRYDETLLEKTEITMKKNESVIEKINLS